LKTWDAELFYWINGGWSAEWWDPFWIAMSDLHKIGWFAWGIIPAAVLLILLKYRASGLAFLLGLLLSLGAADLVAYRGVKIWIKRPRPEVQGLQVQLKTISHSGYSFPSNHAANTMAMAVYSCIFNPVLGAFMLLGALLVGLSRIYVGVHFPLDVLSGWAIGAFLGLIIGRVYLRSVLKRIKSAAFV